MLLIVVATSSNVTLPIHWDIAGQADRYADKWLAFALVVGVYLLLPFLPRLDPGRANYAQFAGAYGILRLTVLTVLSVLTGSAALGLRSAGLVHVVIGAMLIVIGSVLGKLRPNWFAGIRTPWTLTSKRSWLKTHRLGGWLFILWGLIEVLVGLVAPAERRVTLACVVVVSAMLIIYSYIVWRDDPDKLPPAGTQPAPSAGP
ncbi:MAG: SdpI family protein [Chloroflexota bacterium]